MGFTDFEMCRKAIKISSCPNTSEPSLSALRALSVHFYWGGPKVTRPSATLGLARLTFGVASHPAQEWTTWPDAEGPGARLTCVSRNQSINQLTAGHGEPVPSHGVNYLRLANSSIN